MRGRSRKVFFYDTTLRDGEQTPGISFSSQARLEIARALDDLGLDEIEIGFAASGKKARDDMKRMTSQGMQARTLSLARPLQGDIDAAVESGVDGVIIFIGLSDIHLKYKFNMTFSDALKKVQHAVQYAKKKKLFVQISAEDGTRTDNDKLSKFARLGHRLEVDRICVSDTVGCATSNSISEKVKCVLQECDCEVSVHCHNDFGLAVANSVAAVNAGATHLSVTINGLGERSGNASLEQSVMALELLYGYKTNIKKERLLSVSKLISRHAGISPTPNCPIVGENCFRHESGIHVAAILKNPACYEAYDPAIVGSKREITLGKTNGSAAIFYLAKEIGEEIDDTECKLILEQLQNMAGGIDLNNKNILKGIIDKCRSGKHSHIRSYHEIQMTE